MRGNVVSLDEYRRPQGEAAAKAAGLSLSDMAYSDLCDWAGADFNRLVAAARVKDYRPEWIAHQMADYSVEPTPDQAAVLERMLTAAGEFISRRQRWILRQLKAKPMSETALVKLASKAAEFRDYKHPDRCVKNDLNKLVTHNLIQARGVVWSIMSPMPGGSCGAAQASTPRFSGSKELSS